jgi:hypothetical protein
LFPFFDPEDQRELAGGASHRIRHNPGCARELIFEDSFLMESIALTLTAMAEAGQFTEVSRRLK